MGITLKWSRSGEAVNFTCAALKSVGAKWLVQMHENLQDNPGIIVNGFRKAGIQEAIDSTNETATTSDSLEAVPAINSADTTLTSSSDDVIEINS